MWCVVGLGVKADCSPSSSGTRIAVSGTDANPRVGHGLDVRGGAGVSSSGDGPSHASCRGGHAGAHISGRPKLSLGDWFVLVNVVPSEARASMGRSKKRFEQQAVVEPLAENPLGADRSRAPPARPPSAAARVPTLDVHGSEGPVEVGQYRFHHPPDALDR